MEMDKKVALVTGSTSGIGKAVAETFARHHIRVIVSGRDRQRGEQVVEQLRQSGGEAVFAPIDLLDENAPGELVRQAANAWGRLDIIVNNAALLCNKPVEQTTRDNWEQLLRVNVMAPFFIIQAALPYLKASRGTVINVSSTNGAHNQPNNLVYDTTKAALNHMTTGLALDLHPYGIRCNSLAAGGTDTPLLVTWFSEFVDNREEIERTLEAERGKGTMATPQQIADVALFLASDQASWVNGAVIPVDNGLRLLS